MVAALAGSRSAKDMAAVFEGRWSRLRKNWKRVADNYSNDEVHDLRVAIRRFLAIIDVCLYLEKKFDPEKCRRALKGVLDTSSRLRDVQVERQWIAKSLEGNPELQAFDADAADRESKAVRDLKKILRKNPKPPNPVLKARDRIRKVLANRQPPEMRKAAITAVDDHYRRLNKRLSKVNPYDTGSIHRARVALKQFRYAAEIAQPLAGNRLTPQVLRECRNIQGRMGLIQDMEVLGADLRRWTGKNQSRANAMERVLTKLEADRQHAVLDFTKGIGQISSFWKAAR
jgi:CHAD domain-containing protein